MLTSEEIAVDHAMGARDLIRNSDQDTEFVVKIDAGGISRNDAIQRLQFGNDSHFERTRRIAVA
jgi:hypothetical protein